MLFYVRAPSRRIRHDWDTVGLFWVSIPGPIGLLHGLHAWDTVHLDVDRPSLLKTVQWVYSGSLSLGP